MVSNSYNGDWRTAKDPKSGKSLCNFQDYTELWLIGVIVVILSVVHI